jgi:hypothetical protein
MAVAHVKPSSWLYEFPAGLDSRDTGGLADPVAGFTVSHSMRAGCTLVVTRTTQSLAPVHCRPVAYSEDEYDWPATGTVGTLTVLGVVGAVGLKVRTAEGPPNGVASTAEHCVAVGQLSHESPGAAFVPDPLATVSWTGLPLAVEDGSNVTSRPALSTAVHWLVEGQATDVTAPPPTSASAIDVAFTFPFWGSKVTAYPLASTLVHWLEDGQATASCALPTVADCGRPPGCVGSNVTSRPALSTKVH